MTAASDWLEIVVPTRVAATEEVAAQIVDLVDAARAGTQIRGAEVVFWVPFADGEAALSTTRVASRALAARGLPIDAERVRAQPAMPEAEWRDAWKRYFKVHRITRQLVIVPSWETYQPESGDLVIDLDPGQAFGTGAHATTRLMLQAMQAMADDGVVIDRFLDVGAGSGVLSIAAALLWPGATGVAVDNDPLAASASAENAAANRLGDRIEASLTPVGQVDEAFPLVLANIQADVLRALRTDIVARVAPGGALLLSGLLAVHVEGVAADYAAAGLELLETYPDSEAPDWCLASLRRPR